MNINKEDKGGVIVYTSYNGAEPVPMVPLGPKWLSNALSWSHSVANDTATESKNVVAESKNVALLDGKSERASEEKGAIDIPEAPENLRWENLYDPAAKVATGHESKAVHPPEACQRCGRSTWNDVSIHSGRSTRRDCRRCGRTWGFTRWQGVAI